ncbi:sulfatase-like hydrolase/transferase [uncultured Roseibium sp.]|uniref:sulfatase family protein n=1 Tax=uncultured Roseibium sp. TaxID=1936171 RepID=UPI0032169D3F
MKRPNFIVIMTDQQRWDHLGCYGNPVLQTPNIDAIGAAGQRFDRFYVANPICQPNRACLATGQLSTVNGCRQNGIPLSPDQVTYAEVLRAAGWRTALIGKAHFQNVTDVPAPSRQAAGEGDDLPESVALARRDQRDGPDYLNEVRAVWAANPDQAVSLPYYGFEHLRLCIGHGDQVEGHYSRWLRDRCPDAAGLRGPAHALDDPAERVAQCWQTALPEDCYPTAYVAEEAEAYLRSCRADEPFLLVLSFPDPHHPFTPPGRYWDLYDPADVEVPASFGDAVNRRNDLPDVLRQAYRMGDEDPHSYWPFHLSEPELRRIIALNYGAIAMVDDAVGRVMRTLSEVGLDDDTVVCFTSDHGDYMGDHGTVLKMGLHYQSVIRVPFLWRDTAERRQPGVNRVQASAIDFAPTVVQRAGLRVPVGMQGEDIFAAAPDRPVLIEDPGIGVFRDPDSRSALITLVHDDWRLSLLEGCTDWGELYDLGADPNETTNLWFDPDVAGRKTELLLRLAERQLALRDLSLCPTARA